MSDTQPNVFKEYSRKCGAVFIAVVCGTLIMVATSYAPLANHRLTIALVLTVAAVNAFLVAAYLMHLIGESKMILTMLGFTALFFIVLMGLSVWAHHDLPALMAPIGK
jgi:FtsH-binding integral membrane protein